MRYLFLCVCILPMLAFAQTITWAGKEKPMEIGNKVSVLEDPSRTLSFEDVKTAKFTPSTSTNLILGYTESVFWVKFTLENNTAQNLILEIAQAGLPISDLFYQNDSGTIITYKAGSNTAFHQRVIKSSFQVFPLMNGKRDYYIRLTTNSGPIPLRVYDSNTYEESSLELKFVYGMYLGLMLFVLLSNLFFFLSLRNSLYLFNALNVLIFTCFSMVVVDGFVVYFFPTVDMLFWYTFIPPVGVTIQLIYSLGFLEVKKYSPSLYRFALVVTFCYIVWFIVKFFLPFHIVQPINTLQALLSFIIMGLLGISVGRKGNRFGYYFALTYFVYFLLVLTEATYVNSGKPAYLLGFSYSGYATILEALALSFLLSKRFEWEKEAIENGRIEAQLKVIETTQENERIVREQNSMLEEKVTERTHELQAEKQKSDTLLYNILPEEVAKELKEKGSSAARQYENVTVLFTDFVNFTGISESLSAHQLVEEIDRYFKMFDQIIERHNLEKIKTIGDAYLAVCGLPNEDEQHAQKVLNAALDIRKWLLENNSRFNIRMGIHSGPVVAGIVGIKKYAYDIWGDTVNTASRMEQNCEPGKINISGSTYELVKNDFSCVHRGKIPAKNKGEIDMYFIERHV